jgi:hypothetical protein
MAYIQPANGAFVRLHVIIAAMFLSLNTALAEEEVCGGIDNIQCADEKTIVIMAKESATWRMCRVCAGQNPKCVPNNTTLFVAAMIKHIPMPARRRQQA